MRRAIARYGELTGDHIDPRVIDYHTVRFGWVNPLSLGWMCADRRVRSTTSSTRPWYVLCSMWSLDVLATLTGATLDRPRSPTPRHRPRLRRTAMMGPPWIPPTAADAARAV
jgi:hypothetical protein